MKTKSEFLQTALNDLSAYPTVAQYVQAGDPRVLAQLGAQASMLAMLSEQVDVAQFEPFVKARDSTVLADASLKGVLPLGRSCRVTLSVTNGDTAPFTVAAGRRFTDAKGRIYMSDATVEIPAGQTATVACTQRTARTIAHTVATALPFYRMELTHTEAEVFLTTLALWKGAQEFAYAPDWFNVDPNQYAFQVETDERRRMWVCLGAKDVIGYGVQAGDAFEMRISECEGKITDLSPGAGFNLEYVYTPADGLLASTLGEVLDQGAAPPSMADLRVMARYPALYDHNAVYLGEFDFLLRRYLTPIRFLAVWNEQIEEAARGANINSVNRLFVSGLVAGMSDAAFQSRVLDLVNRADDSYKLRFVPACPTPVAMAITGKVAVVHEPAAVEAQIRAAIMARYGDGAPDVSKGLASPFNKQTLYSYLREQVQALQDKLSDIDIDVVVPSSSNVALYSEQFDHATWTKTGVTITANGAAAPDGAGTMDKLVETAVTSAHGVSQSAGTLVVGQRWTLFCFAKAAERSKLVLTMSGEGKAIFDLAAATVTTSGTAPTVEMIAMGGGIYLCVATFIKTNTTGTYSANLYTTTDNYLGVATNGLFLWGFQAENAAQRSGYKPTLGSTVTVAQPLPEHFLYVSAAGLDVTVTRAEFNSGLWNH